MKGNALKAARPRASYDIAREIADMLFLADGEGAGAGDYGDKDEAYEELMEAGKGGGAAAVVVAAAAAATKSGGDVEDGNGVEVGVGGWEQMGRISEEATAVPA